MSAPGRLGATDRGSSPVRVGRRIRFLSSCIAIVLVVVACGNDDDERTLDDEAAGTSAPVDSTETPQSDAPESESPEPPRIPEDFTWSGRYVVPDLDLEVPFTWHGDGGDFQMVAGGEDYPIHFANLIHGGELYTLTYKWPDVPRMPCSHVGAFSVAELNEGFAEASFAGRETLHGEQVREVNHFRAVSVIDLPAGAIPGLEDAPQLRLPAMSGDIYVDIDDPTKVWQLLHFGLQNLYDANLDEWIVIDEIDQVPGLVTLPDECQVGF